MTTYSVMGNGDRLSVLASWAGQMSDVSTKVTTVTNRSDGEDLTLSLTTVSEAAWYAAAWLDSWPAVREHLKGIADWARQPNLGAPAPRLDLSKCRHQDVYSTYDSHEVLDIHLPATLEAVAHSAPGGGRRVVLRAGRDRSVAGDMRAGRRARP